VSSPHWLRNADFTLVATTTITLVGFTLDKNNLIGLRSWLIANEKPTLALTRLAGFDETNNPYEGKYIRPRVAAGLRDFAVSADGDRIVYRHDRTVRLIKIPLK